MFVIVALILIIDLLSFKGLQRVFKNKSRRFRYILYALHWLVPVVLLVLSYIFSISLKEQVNAAATNKLFITGGIFFLFYVPKLIFIAFHIAEEILKALTYLIYKVKQLVQGKKSDKKGFPLSRMKFISTLGLGIAAIPFISILGGMINGRFHFRIVRLKQSFPDLPESFNGLRIVQISDIHISSFYNNSDKLKLAVELINNEEPDLILFTGDMVDNYAEEMNGFIDILASLKAKMGKYSILGNHDYGDYKSWPTEEAKKENHKKMLHYQELSGFKLLLNDAVSLESGKGRIGLIGVENWGKPPFVQYGDFTKARAKVKDMDFTILMSHDPSHWDAEIIGKKNVQLTLSGHTHGMQFGIEKGNIKWSPVQYKYPRWAGLYKEGDQYMYVNRGLGCIGFPARVGIAPEITVIKLETENA